MISDNVLERQKKFLEHFKHLKKLESENKQQSKREIKLKNAFKRHI